MNAFGTLKLNIFEKSLKGHKEVCKEFKLNCLFTPKILGLLRLVQTRLAETTIDQRPVDRKPQLADVTISRNHDWPKAQIDRNLHFRALAMVHLLVFGQF